MTVKELTRAVEELSKRMDKIELNNSEFEKPFYTVAEVAKIFGVTKEAIYKRIKNGEIPAVKFGRMRIKRADLNRLLGKNV